MIRDSSKSLYRPRMTKQASSQDSSRFFGKSIGGEPARFEKGGRLGQPESRRAMVSRSTGLMSPRSVMMPAIKRAGVTSNAGL